MKVDWTWSGKSLPSKKNSKSIKRKKSKTWKLVPFIDSSDEYKAWNVLFVRDIRTLKPIGDWKAAVFTFYSPDNREFDLSNKLESIMDWMVDAGYIKDDSYKYCPDIRIIFGGKSETKEWIVKAEIELRT